jgi:hypothetical protein
MNSNALIHALAGRTILVVEDEYLIADLFVRTLVSVGAKVLGPAPTVADAQLIIAEAARIDCAVLDINCDVPVVLATGSAKTSVPERYQGLHRCAKPVDLQALSSVLRPLFAL